MSGFSVACLPAQSDGHLGWSGLLNSSHAEFLLCDPLAFLADQSNPSKR